MEHKLDYRRGEETGPRVQNSRKDIWTDKKEGSISVQIGVHCLEFGTYSAISIVLHRSVYANVVYIKTMGAYITVSGAPTSR